LSRGRKKIRPYPANWTRGFDLVSVLGLQEAVGGGSLEVSYLRGRVSFQSEESVPSDTRSTSKHGEVKFRSPTKNYVKYCYGDEKPLDTSIKPQSEILREVAEELGLERREEALSINIKERMLVEKMPKELEDLEPLQGYEYIYHKQSSAGDFTDLISRTLGLQKGALRSPTRQIKNELKGKGIIEPKDPITRGIRSILRTDYIMTSGRGGYSRLKNVIDDVHKELTKPNWWQEVGYPHGFKFQDGFRPKNAQIYDLEKRNRTFAVPLPKELYS